MNSLLLQSGQFLSFLTILAVGFVYIVIGWALSHVLGDHADTHGVEGHDSDHNHETVSIFSPKVVAIFMVGFGTGGAIATNSGLGVLGAILVGLSVGLGFGGLGFLFMRTLYAQQASSSIPITAAIGQAATVNTDIPVNGFGEVSLSVNGQYMTYSARLNRSDSPARRGSTVTVVSIQGTSLIVS